MRQKRGVIRSSRTNSRSSHSETDLPKTLSDFLPSDAGCIYSFVYPRSSFGTLCLRHLHKVPVIVFNLRVLRSNWSNKIRWHCTGDSLRGPWKFEKAERATRESHLRVATRSKGIELCSVSLQPPAVVALVFVTGLSRSQGFQSYPSPSSSCSLC